MGKSTDWIINWKYLCVFHPVCVSYLWEEEDTEEKNLVFQRWQPKVKGKGVNGTTKIDFTRDSITVGSLFHY